MLRSEIFSKVGRLPLAFCLVVTAIGSILLGDVAHGTSTTKGDVSITQEDTAADVITDFMTSDMTLNQDYTYSNTKSHQARALTMQGVAAISSHSVPFFPPSQSVKVIEAYVTKPDGTKTKVGASNIFVRPSQAAQDAPGFTSSQTLTIEFPGVTVGSQVNAKILFTQKKPSVVAFSSKWTPPFSSPTKVYSVRINAPASLKLVHAARGGFEIETSTQGDRKILSAKLQDIPQHKSQGSEVTPSSPGVVSPLNFMPVFMISDGQDWASLGAGLYDLVEPALEVSPTIQSLSNTITKGKKGLAAVKAIYNWVTQNIRYVAVTMNPVDGYKPNKPDVILANGYGDCKDYVALTRALLKAQGIASQAAAVNWGGLYKLLPLPSLDQFDHQILYLPDYRMFANPTNTYAELGFMGLGLDGKNTLIYAPKGGLKTIPVPKPQDYTYTYTSTVTLDPDGGMTGSALISATGGAAAALRSQMAGAPSTTNLANELLQSTLYGGYGTVKATSNPRDLDKPLSMAGTWKSPRALEPLSTLRFMIPEGVDFVSPRSLRSFVIPEKPLYPFAVGVGSFKWRYTIIPPKGYTITEKPKDITLSNSVGKFTHRSWIDTSDEKGATLNVSMDAEVTKTYLSVPEYLELRTLLYGILAAANTIYTVTKE